MRFLQLFIIICLATLVGKSQDFNKLTQDENILRAKTKQINQFFRRFNHEENANGKRLYPEDRNYRNNKKRKKYIDILFDNQSSQIPYDLKKQFVEEVVNPKAPKFLDFHAGKWYAEASCKFLFHGKEENILLFLELEEENSGYKWVITNVFFEYFNDFFDTKVEGIGPFLHPLSHELDFMNLHEAFEKTEIIQEYAAKDYLVDFLSIFFYEVKKSNLTFETVSHVKFHFLQIDNWYFEVSEFIRHDFNSGWLISNLMKMTEDEKKQFVKIIHHD